MSWWSRASRSRGPRCAEDPAKAADPAPLALPAVAGPRLSVGGQMRLWPELCSFPGLLAVKLRPLFQKSF